MVTDTTKLDSLLAALIKVHSMPGAIAAIWCDGQLTVSAAGIANLNTGEPMSLETGFLAGSITKLFFATAIMSAVEEGLIELDRPIIEYAPDVQFGADVIAASQITFRHIMSHSSGVDTGSYHADSRRYPEGVEDYRQPVGRAAKLVNPGTYASYNNVAWIVAELVLRRVIDMNARELMLERVVNPLRLRRTVFSAEEAILHRTAVGSFRTEGIGRVATPQFMYPSAWLAPGTATVTTANDLIKFLRMHLNDGIAVDGNRILDSATVQAMQVPTSPFPTDSLKGFGLGWRYLEGNGRRVYSHAGGSLGGIAHVAIAPGEDLAIATFVNGLDSIAMHTELMNELMHDLSPLRTPEPIFQHEIEHAPFVGMFRRAGELIDIRSENGGLIVKLIPIEGEMVGATAFNDAIPSEFRVYPTNQNTLSSDGAVYAGSPVTIQFLETEAGNHQLLFFELSMQGQFAQRVLT